METLWADLSALANNSNWVDLSAFVMILMSSFFGLLRGLVRAVFGIVGLVAAFITAKTVGGILLPTVEAAVGKGAVSLVLSYVVVFIAVLVLFAFLSLTVRALAKKLDLGGFDHIGGLLFGIVRGGIFVWLTVLVLACFPLQKTAIWRESKILPVFGHMTQLALQAPWLQKYQPYWHFDEQSRPRLEIAGIGKESGLAEEYLQVLGDKTDVDAVIQKNQ